MPNVNTNGIQIEYDTFGDSASPPIVLIMGLGGQLILWDESFCQKLSEKNLFVIRFDNRDVGLSTLFEDMGTPDIMQTALARAKGETIKPYYTFDDMADDIIGLLDALRIKKAHICGESMGASIAFNVGYRYPSRVISLISIVGSTGNPELPQSKPGALDLWINPEPDDVGVCQASCRLN